MSSSTNILKEYLVSLGFLVDERSAKKADGALIKLDVNAKAVAKGVMAAGVAVQGFVALYAYQMEKLYYASKRSDASVGNLQAVDFAFRQIGGQSGVMVKAVESMVMAMRSSPGLVALVENLGVPVRGRDKAEVFKDLIKALSQMPFHLASQYASMFGIDPTTLLTLEQGINQFEKMAALRKQMAKDAGLDLDKAAEAGKEYSNMLGQIAERFGILKDVIGVKLLPIFKEWSSQTDRILGDLTKIIGQSTSGGDFWKRIADWFKSGNPNGPVKLTEESRNRLDQMGEKEPPAGTWLGRLFQKAEKIERDQKSGTGGSVSKSSSSEVRVYGDSRAYPKPVNMAPNRAQEAISGGGEGGSSAQALFARLEAIYGLPAGFLDRMWKKESNRGDPRFMTSKAGAQGHFQFMPATARQYGLDDPGDLAQSATAAAKYIADLLKKYKGDLMKATAAYNWGPGKVDRYGLGRAPAETRDYVKTLTGKEINLNQTNYYSINGENDKSLLTQIEDRQEQSNSSIVRDLRQRVY